MERQTVKGISSWNGPGKSDYLSFSGRHLILPAQVDWRIYQVDLRCLSFFIPDNKSILKGI